MIKLVIFDVDGTLARAFTRKILPHKCPDAQAEIFLIE
jgi:hydroxymethylpyrimidine pyrophosphatase-like HAD family hydrolase